MNSKDFYELGEELQKIVQTAIDSKDFKELNKTVRNTVNEAVEAVKTGVSEMSETMAKAKESHGKVREERAEAKGTQQEEVQAEYKEVIDKADSKELAKQEAQYFIARPRGGVLGGIMVLFGFSSAVILAIVLIGFFALDMVFGGVSLLLVPMVVLAIIICLFLFMGVQGRKMRNRVKRFKKYKRTLDGREFCDIEELAEAVEKRTEFVVKDLRGMIETKWFLQGHIDTQEKHLIITDQMYEQYTLAMQSLAQRQALAKAEAEKMADPKYSEEVRQMLLEGKRFVNHIRECNDAIPGVEISTKMDRLELIVSRIFAQVEKNPAVASELHQFMTYYLPTTEKLLDAYRDLDQQPVQGQNIVETKKEIEATLDTLNQAFEKLLDSFYRDMAWDVTTDISVLNTMLAKEGLTDDEMKMTTKVDKADTNGEQ